MAPHGGREVKNLGNGVMIVFPSLSAALDASVAMQRAVTHGPGRLGIRIGLSSGDAIEADGDVSGPPIAEAARLCARAKPGQIVLTELIAKMARKSGHSFRAIGTLDLREEADPVPAVVLQWEPRSTRPSRE
jgi:class 3 adenylate cyclase